MSEVKIFWDPKGFELDSLGRKTLSGAPADGDTPYVRVPIRMLSVDTPETNYPGVGKPSNSDARLTQLAVWIEQGQAPIGDGLAAHLLPRLRTGTAGTLQETQGEAAKKAFKDLLEARLTRPSGSKRSLFVHASEEHFDAHGRLLAYIAPSYSKAELARMSRRERATFNFSMVELGWAAPFLIYPSLPAYGDVVMLHEAAKTAVEDELGAWAEPLMLTAYEWRMCIKLHRVTKKLLSGDSLSSYERTAFATRYCADATTLEIFRPQDYFKVEPYNRVFIWPGDVNGAVGRMNLLPGN